MGRARKGGSTEAERERVKKKERAWLTFGDCANARPFACLHFSISGWAVHPFSSCASLGHSCMCSECLDQSMCCHPIMQRSQQIILAVFPTGSAVICRTAIHQLREEKVHNFLLSVLLKRKDTRDITEIAAHNKYLVNKNYISVTCNWCK